MPPLYAPLRVSAGGKTELKVCQKQLDLQYHLFVGTPLSVSGDSPSFHRELSIIPHRIRVKDERPSKGESSRGGTARSLCSWRKLWSFSFSDRFFQTALHNSSAEARLCMKICIHISFTRDSLSQRSTPPSGVSRGETRVCQQDWLSLK